MAKTQNWQRVHRKPLKRALGAGMKNLSGHEFPVGKSQWLEGKKISGVNKALRAMRLLMRDPDKYR